MHGAILALSILTVAIVMALVGTMSYIGGVNLVQDNLDGVYRSELVQFNRKLVFQMREIGKACQLAAADARLVTLLETYERQVREVDLAGAVRTGTSLEAILTQYKLYSDNIESIVLIGQSHMFAAGPVLFYNNPLDSIRANEAVYRPMKESPAAPVLFPTIFGVTPETIIPGVHVSLNVLFSRPSYGSLVTRPPDGRELAAVFVITKPEFLSGVLDSGVEIQVLDQGNQAIWSNREPARPVGDFQFTQQASDSTGTVYMRPGSRSIAGYFLNSEIGGWRIVLINRIEDFRQRLVQVRNQVLLSVLVTILVAGVLSRFLLRGTLRLLEILVERLRRFRRDRDMDDRDTIEVPTTGFPSFRTRLLLYFTTILLFPVLVFSLVFSAFFTNLMEREVEYSIRTNYTRLKENVNTLVESQKNILLSMVFDPAIQSAVMGTVDDETKVRIEGLLENKMRIGQYHDSVSLFDREGRTILQGFGYRDTVLSPDLVEMARTAGGQVAFAAPEPNEFNRMQVRMVALISPRSPERQGFIRVAFDEEDVERIYRDSLGAGVSIHVESADGIVLSHVDKQRIGLPPAESGTSGTYDLRESLSQAPWQVVLRYSYESLRAGTRRFFTNLVLATTGVSLFFLLVLFYLSTIFIRPLNLLRHSIATTESALEPTGTQGYYFSEINALVQAYNDMILRINSLIDEVLVAKMAAHSLEVQKKDLEMIALQAQINPHFLCNTLESIKWIVVRKDTEKAIGMIESLNNLFRFGISRMENIIRVRQEITYAQSYTDIIRLRYSRRIEFRWDVDESVLDDRTPKLILQPMIENAIHHGVEPMEQDGVVEVSCRADGHDLVYSVSDNGIGMEPDRLDELRRQIMSTQPDKIGLANVNARIRLYYGPEYGVRIESRKGVGTTVMIRIPRNGSDGEAKRGMAG